MASNLLDTGWRGFLQAEAKKVGQASWPVSSELRSDWQAKACPTNGDCYAAASVALNLTLTRRLTPGSCMVTPYNASAASMVFLEWVMTTNWVLTDISAMRRVRRAMLASSSGASRSEEHTSELQSLRH